jgi:hypothetical protein
VALLFGTIESMRGVAVAVLALIFAGAAPGAGGSRPNLTIRDTSPLTVRGRHFHSHELVMLTVVTRGQHEKQVRATAAGTFTARFRFSIRECAMYRVSAHGDGGSRALYRSPITECGTQPAGN